MAKILIVDDNAMDRVTAGRLVEKGNGLKPLFAEDGKQALAAIARDAPDLVLTDLLMPDMDGLELVKVVRERHPLVPVILMTNFGSEEIAIQALKKGAASYVPKRNLARDLAE